MNKFLYSVKKFIIYQTLFQVIDFTIFKLILITSNSYNIVVTPTNLLKYILLINCMKSFVTKFVTLSSRQLRDI